MKKVLTLIAIMLLSANFASAQGGSIALFADPEGTDCNLRDVPGLCLVYVVHVNTAAALAVEFGITQPTCLRTLFLGYQPNFPADFGDPMAAGRQVSYGACLGSPIWVATLQYFCQGLTAPCCVQGIVPHNVTGVLGARDCQFDPVDATGGEVRWNADASCQCTVAAEESTWGAIKSIYAN